MPIWDYVCMVTSYKVKLRVSMNEHFSRWWIPLSSNGGFSLTPLH